MSNPSNSTRFAFLPVLALVFITLKLCAVIAWSWWWVLAPVWIPVAVAAACLMLLGAVAMLANENG